MSARPHLDALNVIPARSGTAFHWKKGQFLEVVDLEGEQVSDLICFNAEDPREHLSSGRTLDFAESFLLTRGHNFYSNRSNVMFSMIEDTCGRHDFMLAPCSAEMFHIMHGEAAPHKGCFGNLRDALAPHGIEPDAIPVTFNIFMHVALDSERGTLNVKAPLSKAGDRVVLRAEMDLLVGLTACSAEMSNNYTFKPIGYRVFD